MTDKIKILYVFAALPVGGAEQLLVNELERLDRNLFDPMVAVISEKGPIGEVIEQMGIPLVPLHRMKKNQFDYGIIGDLKTLMIREGISLVHTHLYDGGKYGRIAARLAGVPSIVHTVHNIYVKRRTKHHLINKALSLFTDRIIAVSATVKESIIRYDHINPSKIRVIHNGIDLSKFQDVSPPLNWRAGLGLKEDAFVIGVIARLEEQKGHHFLLEALAGEPELLNQLKVLIIGDGKLRSSLEAESREKGLSRQVLFLGTQNPIAPILKALDLFLLPSLWEGFSLAILEALASGVPVIATRVGGAEEVITSGREGLLIPPGDVRSLTQAIEEALSHRETFREMARRGEEKVRKEFSLERHMDQLTDLYLNVLSEKGVRPIICP